MSVLLCPHCGTSNRVGSNFCNACGTDLRGDVRGDVRGEEPGDRSGSSSRDSSGDSPTSQQPTPPPTLPPTPSQTPEREPPDRASDTPDTAPRAAAPPDTRAADRPPAPPMTEQPWLDSAFDEGGGFEEAGTDADGDDFVDDTDDTDDVDDADDADAEGAPDPRAGPRLVTGIQGLLDPIRISRRLEESPAPSSDPLGDADAHTLPDAGLGRAAPRVSAQRVDVPRFDALRRFRNLLYEDPQLAGARHLSEDVPAPPHLYNRWLFLLVVVLIGVPVLWGWGRAENLPPAWPGLAEAYGAIESLPPDSLVVIYWAYDPATAGELDLVARPVFHHLLTQRVQLVGVSSLPAGPATARRLIEAVRETRDATGLFSAAARNPWPVRLAFLPGGSSTLPLVATDLATALDLDPDTASARDLAAQPPALTVIFAAQTEDVQNWLEQVQTRLGVPALAVVSAGADPGLRPFLDSGQLRGLVSGFDGAYHYDAQVAARENLLENVALRRHVNAQNWAHMAIVAVLVAGNLIVLLRRAGQG